MTTSFAKASSPHEFSAMACDYNASAYPGLGISADAVAASPVLRASLALRRKVVAARHWREARQCGAQWIEMSGGAQ